MQDAAAAYDETSIHIRQTHVRCEWRGQRRRRQLRPTAANPSKYKMNYGRSSNDVCSVCVRESERETDPTMAKTKKRRIYTHSVRSICKINGIPAQGTRQRTANRGHGCTSHCQSSPLHTFHLIFLHFFLFVFLWSFIFCYLSPIRFV